MPPANQPSRVRNRLNPLLLAAAVLLVHGCAGPRNGPPLRPLTLEEIYGPPETRVNFSGQYAHGLEWLPDGRGYLERRDGVLHAVDPVSGAAVPAYDHAALEAALAGHEDFDAEAARRLARRPTLFSEDRAAVLIEHGQRLYFYRFADGQLRRVAETPAERRVLTLSPDARRAAFVRESNLYVLDLAAATEQALTADGGETLLNGVLDWVYQEEVYGRGNWRGYWWAPDSAALAYLQLDERDVPVYPLVDLTETHPPVESLRYPKAGDPNPRVRLGIVPAAGGATVWVDLGAYADQDILIVGVDWAPDGRLVYAVQDRESRWLDLNDADPQTGAARRLLHETSPAWVDYFGPPHWLADGSFLWSSARDGWQHLYHYARDGALRRRVTAGPWEARKLHGVDEAGGWVYLTGTRDTPLEEHAYRVPLAGGPVERLTEPGCTHAVAFDPQWRYFIDTFSNVTTPPRVHLRDARGGLVRIISANEVPELAARRLSPPEFVRVPTPAGHALNGLLIRPPGRPRGRPRPVVLFTYAGPHAPCVHNRWGGREYLFQQWLAQEGFLVWVVDPYSASGEGHRSAWRCYQQLGVTELADLEASLHWLAAAAHADLERVAIDGYSYGGFMAAFALTHSTLFRAGIAGAGLSDWRNYDSIYTEKFMRTPANNPAGYQASSVMAAASRLHGRLLLVHGLLDDNVHAQNTFQLAQKLQEAGQDFDLMIYPEDGHGIHHGARHFERLRLDFLTRNLAPRPGTRGPRPSRR